MTEIQIILPATDDDALSEDLRNLTSEIQKVTGNSGFGLGGPDGYGENFDTPAFTMRRYYWGDCTCGAMDAENDTDCAPDCPVQKPNFIYKPSGFEVRWYKWIGRDNELKGECADLAAMFADCIKSIPDGKVQS